ncbi:Ref family recombination enhancement nuclease [Pandoraea sp. XJJ-1]|uniref:Ref family recombination enhancement nuclease n=1 Tax=Pandoraea sp. XJJ-1 TaxID=3002643 RepID=UPI003FA34EE8
MKGRSPTSAQKHFHDDLCRHIGCVACRFEGIFNDYVSLHHIDGRTKPDAHWLVLPLCGGHHQDNGTAVAVHPYKAPLRGALRRADGLAALVHRVATAT